MAQIVDMPQLSDTMREGMLRKWRKSEGDRVSPGDLFAELEFEKAVMEWEVTHEGTLLKKLIDDGTTVPVGSPIAILGAPGEDIAGLLAEAQARMSAEAGARNLAPASAAAKPLSPMRKTIARRMVESKTSIPHFYLTTDADMDAAMDFRDQVHGARVSVNDLVLKATALALRKHPEANASLADDTIVQHARVDIGMAVAIEDGLVTPIIRHADKKTLGQIGDETRDLAARARGRKLRADEMTGGTFTVSSLGRYGIDHFSAIINPPEAAILAVGRVRREPVVDKEGKIVVGQRMSLTLSCDHRIIDGSAGARLLQAIVAILERPLTLAS